MCERGLKNSGLEEVNECVCRPLLDFRQAFGMICCVLLPSLPSREETGVHFRLVGAVLQTDRNAIALGLTGNESGHCAPCLGVDGMTCVDRL
jgi:hypothetical protein